MASGGTCRPDCAQKATGCAYTFPSAVNGFHISCAGSASGPPTWVSFSAGSCKIGRNRATYHAATRCTSHRHPRPCTPHLPPIGSTSTHDRFGCNPFERSRIRSDTARLAYVLDSTIAETRFDRAASNTRTVERGREGHGNGHASRECGREAG